MRKDFTCTECPQGCKLTVETSDGQVNVTGNKCPKGEAYGKSEAFDPRRILAATVRTNNLPIKMLPVRTSKPIPRARMNDAMRLLRQMDIGREVRAGEVIVKDFIEKGTDLIATRTICKE